MDLFTLFATIGLKDSEFTNGINNAQSKLKAMDQDFKSTSESLSKFEQGFTKFALGAGAALTVVGTLATKVGIDYESAFAGVRKTVDATEEQFNQLSTGIRNMAKEIPVSANSLAGLAEAAGQLGIKTENILGFTRVVADLGVATNIAGQEGAAQIARFANIVGMSQNDFDKFGSSIVALGNNFATTEAEILAMSMRLAGAGEQIGLSESDILGLATGLSSLGIESEMGGSAFSKVMIQMQLAAEMGGQELENFASVAGMSADQFATAFKDDAAGALVEFISGLNDTERNGKSAIAVLDGMGISEIRMRDALLRASNSSDLFTNSISLANTAWIENTALSREAEQRYATTASQLEILKNKAIDVGISFFGMISTSLLSAVQNLSTGLDFLSQNLGIILPVVTTLSVAIGGLAIVMNMQKMIAGVTLAFQAFNLVIAANPIGIVIVAVAALVAGLITLWNTNEDFRNALIAAWKAIVAFLEPALTGIKDFFISTWNAIFTFFQPLINGIRELFETAVIRIREIAEQIFNGLREFWNRNGEEITAIFTRIWTGISNFLTGVFNAIKIVVEFVFNAIKAYIIPWLDLMKVSFENAWNTIKNNIQVVFDTIKGIIDGALRIIQGLWDVFAGVFTGDWERVWNGIKEIFSGIWDSIVAILSGAFDIGKNLIKGFWNGINDAKDWLMDKISGFFGGVLDDIKDFFGIESPSKVMAQIGKFTAQGFVDGILGMSNAVNAAMESTFGGFDGTDISASLGGIGGIGGIALAGAGTSSNNVYNLAINSPSQSPYEAMIAAQAVFDRARWQ